MAELEKCIITKFRLFFVPLSLSLYCNNEKRTHTQAQQTNVYENSICMKINKMAAVWEAQGSQHCPCVCVTTTTNSIKTFTLAPN